MKLSLLMIACSLLQAQEGIPGPPPPVVPAPAPVSSEPEPPKPQAKFKVTVSHQPLEVFKAAFMEKLNNVAMYDALVCNSGDAQGTVSGGMVMQAAASKVSIINRGLVEMTAMRAKKKSKKYIAAEIAKWVALAGATLVSGGVISASDSVSVIFPVVAAASDRLSKNWDSIQQQMPLPQGWLAADEAYILAPKACTTRLFLGGFRPGFQSSTIEVH